MRSMIASGAAIVDETENRWTPWGFDPRSRGLADPQAECLVRVGSPIEDLAEFPMFFDEREKGDRL